jgi:hypothetical protein
MKHCGIEICAGKIPGHPSLFSSQETTEKESETKEIKNKD